MYDLWRNNLRILIEHVGNVTHVEQITGVQRQTLNAICKGRRAPAEEHIRAIERAYGFKERWFDVAISEQSGPNEQSRARARNVWLTIASPDCADDATVTKRTRFGRALRWNERKGIACSAWFAREAARELHLALPEHLEPADDACQFTKDLYHGKLNFAVASEMHATSAKRRHFRYRQAVKASPTSTCQGLLDADLETLRFAIRERHVDLTDKRQLGWALARFNDMAKQNALGTTTLRGVTAWLYRQRDNHHDMASAAIHAQRAKLQLSAPAVSSASAHTPLADVVALTRKARPAIAPTVRPAKRAATG